MGKQSPKTPDPNQIAQQQADFNRINLLSPYGSATFFGPGQTPPGAQTQSVEELDRAIALIEDRYRGNTEGSSPERSRDFAQLSALKEQRNNILNNISPVSSAASLQVELSPEQQRILDQQLQAQTLLGQTAIEGIQNLPTGPVFDLPGVDPLDFRGLGRVRIPGRFGFDIGDESRRRVEEAQFNRALSLLNPEFERQERATLQRLANQGLPQTSEAYLSDLGQFQQSRNRSLEDLALGAVLAGGQEQSRLFDIAQGTFGSNLARAQAQLARRGQRAQEQALEQQSAFGLRQQLANEQALERSAALNQILSTLGLQQVQLPQPVAPGQVEVPVFQQPQGSSGLLPGLLGLGGTALGGFFGGPAGAFSGFQTGAGLGTLFAR